jgi:AcrR family transcriptional regulator
MDSASGRKGRPKGDKRQRTRAAIIAAAAEVIGEKGYDRTSLEEVAARAGMTRGAIYGNFKSKDELLFAFVESAWRPISPRFEPGATLKQQMRILGEAVAAAAKARQHQAAGATAFQLYVLTHPDMRRRMSEENRKVYRRVARLLTQVVPAEALPMPPEQFVKVLDALTTGLLFTYFQTPDLIAKADFVAAFEALA